MTIAKQWPERALRAEQRVRELEAELARLRKQRDALLAALRGGTFSLDYDEQQHDYVLHYHASYEEAEAIKIAISEVEGEK